MDFQGKYDKYNKRLKLWAVLFFVSFAAAIGMTVFSASSDDIPGAGFIAFLLWIFVVVSLVNLVVNSNRRRFSSTVLGSGKEQLFDDIDEGRIDFPLMKISVGQNGFVYNDGGVLYDDIFWVYKQTQSYSVYFVPVAKQSQLIIALTNGSTFTIHIKGSKKWEEEISELINFLMGKNENIRVGFVREHQQAFSALVKERKREAKLRKKEMKQNKNNYL
ncbi:MAG: hypothetical protein J6K77_05280 [Ruminococcus sp.]|nr:hypothetical protein [Ruminococcus sp.]